MVENNKHMIYNSDCYENDDEEYNFSEVKNILDDIQPKGKILVFADVARWNGRFNGCAESEGPVSYCLNSHVIGASELEVYTEGRELKATEFHHDGTNYYTFREVKANVSEKKIVALEEAFCKGEATQEDIDKITKPMGHYPAKAFGFKLQTSKKESLEKE